MKVSFSTNQSCVSCKGLYQRVGTLSKMTGRSSVNKVLKIINEFEYYPYVNETKESIEASLERYMIGRSFIIWEKDHGHQEGTYYAMNNIRVKDAIAEKDKDAYIGRGYMEYPVAGILSHEDFMRIYNNEAYGTMDVHEYKKDKVAKFIESENLQEYTLS